MPIAPHLSVTFSRPMVAVTSHDQLSAREVPVRLEPEPPGKWRWLGTKTLLFEPTGRFPMATEYTAEVPADTKSATEPAATRGRRPDRPRPALAEAKRWKFATPPPQVKATYPNDGPHIRNPLMFVEFDQRIDPAAVLETIRVGSGRTNWPLRLADSEEIEADEAVSRLARAAEKGRWLAFRVVGPANAGSQNGASQLVLPGDANINVSIGPGTPSAEGPRKTTDLQGFSFRTYGPLRVRSHECGYGDDCTPFAPWRIEFSNPLDEDSFQKSQVRVVPDLPGMKTEIYGNTLSIEGASRGRTAYRVTLDDSIRDRFGQTLGKDATVTFNVGSATPALGASKEGLVVLDPAGSPSFSVFSINIKSLRAHVYAVGVEHWQQFAEYMRGEQRGGRPTPPGRLVVSKTISVKAKPDEMAETRIDLSPALQGGFGQAIVTVEESRWVGRLGRDSISAWVQVTGIGLDAFVDNTDLVGWANSLKDGKPLNGVEMAIVSPARAGDSQDAPAGTTGADGLARLSLKDADGKGTSLLVARKGKDTAILPSTDYWWSGDHAWRRKESSDAFRWYVFDDRAMYRPGEEVHVKGWIRQVGGGKDGDIGLIRSEVQGVTYAMKDSRGNEILKGRLSLNALGGFDTAFKLPDTMNLGHATLSLSALTTEKNIGSLDHAHRFQVQEFRRPEYEVTATGSEGPHFVGDHTDVTVAASYFAGGGLPNADVTWRVTSSPGRFTPPNRDDFTFGKWIPWWIYQNDYGESRTESFSGKTDAAGKHRLRIDFDSANPPRPSSVEAQASVTDVNRQTWSASARMLVHPADLYVGLRSDRTFVQKGEPLVVQAIVTDLDGKAIANREIKMRAVLLDWVYEKGEWIQKEINPQDCSVRSQAGPVQCSFETKEGGVYSVTATILDDRERKNESELTLWVAGGKLPPQRDIEQEKAELIPDRKEYQDGDTAEVLVQAPFYPAEGVLTLRRSGIVHTERFTMDGPSHTLRVPIKDSYTPNLHVQVDLVGAATRTDDEGKPLAQLPKRPAFAKGELNLSVPPLKRRLAVTATPRDLRVEPGGETVVDVELRDAADKPVSGGELAVVVVDEAILALTDYELDDPVAAFYLDRDSGAEDYHLRESILLASPVDLIGKPGVGGGGGGGRGAPSYGKSPVFVAARAPVMEMMERAIAFDDSSGQGDLIRIRLDFNALATFAATVPTDANGRASVKVKLPDNLTRYRVMAVAVAEGKQFGSVESAITARLPLMVRPSAPRFLNFGDRFELPVVVQNQTDSPIAVDVAVRAANAELIEGQGRRVTVPANDRVEVRFPATASRPGTARFQIGAVSGRWTDAAEVELPVWTPATTEAFATYGEIDQGAIIQPVEAPSDVVEQFGGLEITTSSTELQALTDAVLYLTGYPFECSEQLASRVLAVAALRDVLAAFEAKGLPKPEELVEAVRRDIKQLDALQNEDGSFAFWRRGDKPWPYLGIHVAHALQRAKEKDFSVPDRMFDRSKKYLREIERHIPSYYGADIRRVLVAYALYVRNRMGDRDTARARRIINEAGLENLSLEAIGWLLAVLSGDEASSAEVQAIRRHLNNRAEETAGAAHFTAVYSDGAHLLLHSERRADGIILEALIGDQPENDLIAKIARGLLAHRKRGRWENTQENVFILLALDRYFAAYEKVTPDFVARAWLGDRYAGEREFKGRSTERYHVAIPMRYLAESAGPQNLALSKEGPGRLYYRVGMQYAPASFKLAAADYGFTVERSYEAIDDLGDVRRDEDGVWHIKAGAKVRVRLTMVAPARRYHVALVDPLPAGLEVLNPALATTGSIPEDPKDESKKPRWWWWTRPWFEHQNMRDERVEAFTSLLWEGVHDYSYVARATTPGTFIVPPPKAEEMYHPETFGRGATDRVIVTANDK
ncbi:MAG: MG2 domain-containing protein [Blastocatellia bacterium]|nr:MG2 domain-containing protein [Blastocatellia bacterium]